MATVLVVDDEKNYLWMLEELFQSEGYEQHEQHQQGIEMGEGCQNAQDDGTY